MAIDVCGSSKNIREPRLQALSLLVLDYKMLEFCPKNLHRNQHIFGIMHNLNYDMHFTILNAYGCITPAFLRQRSIPVFLIYLNC